MSSRSHHTTPPRCRRRIALVLAAAAVGAAIPVAAAAADSPASAGAITRGAEAPVASTPQTGSTASTSELVMPLTVTLLGAVVLNGGVLVAGLRRRNEEVSV